MQLSTATQSLCQIHHPYRTQCSPWIIVALGIVVIVVRSLLLGSWFAVRLVGISIKVLCHFDAFHEGNDFSSVVNNRVEVLAFHFLLPGIWCSEEKHINEFIVGQLLVGAEIGWTKMRNLLKVDAHEILGMGVHTDPSGALQH